MYVQMFYRFNNVFKIKSNNIDAYIKNKLMLYHHVKQISMWHYLEINCIHYQHICMWISILYVTSTLRTSFKWTSK